MSVATSSDRRPPPTLTAADGDGRVRNVRDCCRRVFHFLFSQLGLCAVVFAYAVVGAFVFRHLEQTNEVHECNETRKNYEEKAVVYVENLWQVKL